VYSNLQISAYKLLVHKYIQSPWKDHLPLYCSINCFHLSLKFRHMHSTVMNQINCPVKCSFIHKKITFHSNWEISDLEKDPHTVHLREDKIRGSLINKKQNYLFSKGEDLEQCLIKEQSREMVYLEFYFISFSASWVSTHCKDAIPKIRYIHFQERNCAATVPIPRFMVLCAIYIFPWLVCIFCCRKIGGPIMGIYKSLTDIWMWKLGLRPPSSFYGNT
jgi:hypothetical protein